MLYAIAMGHIKQVGLTHVHATGLKTVTMTSNYINSKINNETCM